MREAVPKLLHCAQNVPEAGLAALPRAPIPVRLASLIPAT